MKEVNEAVIIAALSLVVVETIKCYRETAPSLADVRAASPHDYTTRQLILDADMLSLVIVVTVAGSAAILTGKWYPLIFGVLAIVMISAVYRAVLRSSNEGIQRV